MNIERAAEKIAEVFREMHLDVLLELSVSVEVATPLADELRRRGFEVTAQPRFADVERKNIVRYGLRVERGTFE